MSHTPVCAHIGDDDGPRRALVLSGGGMRLSYQAGAIRALLESGLRFHHVDGTSGGSLNLSMLLTGQDIHEMCERWRALNLHDVVTLAPPSEYLNLAEIKALSASENVRDKVLPALGIDVECIHQAEGLTGAYNILDYATKEVSVVEHTDIDADLLVAGMALAGVMPPLERDGHIYLDSGFVQDANLLDCVRRGCSELWVIWGLGNTPVYRGGLLRLYVQMLEMSANSAIIREVRTIADINQRIRAGETVLGHESPISVHVVRSHFPLPLDPDLYKGRIDSGTLIDMGYSDACAYLASTAPEGVALDDSITRQAVPEPGVAFRLSFRGSFAMGASEPTIGAEKGESMTFTAGVRVLGLDDFIADDDRSAELFARVSHIAFGRERPGYGGVYRLFTPGVKPGEKRIEYQLLLDLEDKPHCLYAWQELRDDRGIDLLADLSTLYLQLYEGSQPKGSVLGAGILKVDGSAMEKLTAHVCPIEGDSPLDETAVLAKFAGFYLGELSETCFQAATRSFKFW